MKFVVTHYPLNEVEVRLHEDTKKKLKRAAWIVYYGAAASFVAKVVYDKRNEPSED